MTRLMDDSTFTYLERVPCSDTECELRYRRVRRSSWMSGQSSSPIAYGSVNKPHFERLIRIPARNPKLNYIFGD